MNRATNILSSRMSMQARMALLSVLILAGWQAKAQNRSTAEIVGTVTDPGGALVPAATVKITNVKTGTSAQVLTNPKGSYDIPFLDPGLYTVEFQATGFDRYVRNGIDLELDQVARVDARMKLGSVDQVVTVSGDCLL